MIALLATLAYACPNIDTEVERATSALVAGDPTGARAALDTAESAFACAAASPTQLAGYWLVEGAAAHLGGDTTAARAAFSAARGLAPDRYDARLGPDVRTAWSAARPEGEGSLLLEPPRAALVDGAGVSAWPLTVSATPHLVQVVGANGTVRFARVVRIGAGEDAVVETGLGTEPDTLSATDPLPETPFADPSAHKKKSPAMLILAGVAAAGAGACVGGALAQNGAMNAAEDIDTLDAAFGTQKVLGYSGYGLAGAAAAAFTLHFVIK